MSELREEKPIAWSQQSYGFWSEMSEAARDLEPAAGTTPGSQLNRRSALGLLAASAALAAMPGCRRPDTELRPYTRMPDNVVPGLSLFYSTSVARGGDALPVLVETHEGRPTKVEGHPGYNRTQGASDAITQAAILELYDPDRLNLVRRGKVTSSWKDFDAFADPHFTRLLDNKGEGLGILTDATPSPAWSLLRQHLKNVAPEARWHIYEPSLSGNEANALRALTGKSLRPRFDFSKADVVVSLDADLLNTAETSAIGNARTFAGRRVPDESGKGMNRLYVFEPMLTVTGGMADHRFNTPAHAVSGIALALANELKLFDSSAGWDAAAFGSDVKKPVGDLPVEPAIIKAVAADLKNHRGRCLVVAGARQPPMVHALAYAINVALENADKCVSYASVDNAGDAGSLAELTEAIDAGKLNTLVVVGGNPVYDAPADFKFAEKLAKVRHTVRLGLYEDETARACRWRLPAAHTFESWGDCETLDGDYLPSQPMIAPLYNGRSPLTLLAKLLRFETDQEYEVVQASFAARESSLPGGLTFDRWIHDGMAEVKRPEFTPLLNEQVSTELKKYVAGFKPAAPAATNLEACFQFDTSVYDGRFANLGWLQEMPDPVTKLTWDNAAIISRVTANGLGLSTGDVVELSLGGRTIEAPVLVQAGHADHSVTLPLGYGRQRSGRVGDSVGFNAYPLRTSTTTGMAAGLEIKKTGRRHKFALAQQHDRIDDRDIAREQTIEQFTRRAEAIENASHAADASSGAEHSAENHSAAKHEKSLDGSTAGHEGHGHHAAKTLIEPPKLDGKHQWGMVIDLNRCIGCSACMVACQSENNIPVVGKEEVAIGRSMHWIRVDRYYRGPEAAPDVIHEPVACVHCENAPCETVCPVNAAVHSPEGLNLQVYNRCVGTRYCSNNCPYKVRRFNWFDYQQRELDQLRLGPLGDFGMEETLKMQKNPDVTVRMRGVMEKCTYCVQRIERGKAGAKLANPGSPDYTLQDGQVVPACAQACPSQAIIFGDLNDKKSAVVQQKNDPRRFDLLDEIGTKPRTSYLSRLRNPNPRITLLLKKGEGA